MELLQQLAVALGLAGLSGINLYLTVFAAGLAINQQWIILEPQFAHLELLGHPAIITVAAILYLLEFFADKIPWVDSLWDAIHTVIRPIGGAFLAIQVLGQPDPVFGTIIALLAGGVSLTFHGAKAGTRLMVNASPEPLSNIALSVTEDVAVVGGLVLLHRHPLIALAVLTLLLAGIVWAAPRLLRAIRAKGWLAWRKLRAPGAETAARLSARVPADIDLALHRTTGEEQRIRWAAPCLSAKGQGIPRNVFGHLVAVESGGGAVYFAAKSGLGGRAVRLDLTGYRVAVETGFLADSLVLYAPGKKNRFVFLFDRGARAALGQVEEALGELLRAAG